SVPCGPAFRTTSAGTTCDFVTFDLGEIEGRRIEGATDRGIERARDRVGDRATEQVASSWALRAGPPTGVRGPCSGPRGGHHELSHHSHLSTLPGAHRPRARRARADAARLRISLGSTAALGSVGSPQLPRG